MAVEGHPFLQVSGLHVILVISDSISVSGSPGPMHFLVSCRVEDVSHLWQHGWMGVQVQLLFMQSFR